MDDTAHPAVQATIRHALGRGYLTRERLREALLLHEQLQAAGRGAPLLTVLAARFLRPEHVPELSRVFREAQARGDAPGRREAPAAEDDALAKAVDVPDEVLSRSCEALKLPPEADPEPVRRFLRESELALARPEDLEDRVFVELARRAGYPTADELRGLAREQADRRRQGERVSLYTLALLRGLLDERKQRRFARWAKQVAAREAAPLEEEPDDEAPAAPPLVSTLASTGAPPPSPSAARRVLAASAADLELPGPACTGCGAELEALALLEGGRSLCPACAAKAGPVKLSAPPAAGPPAAPRREGRVRKAARAVRDSAAFVVRGLVKRPPPGAPRTESPRAPRALVVGLSAAGVATALLLLGLAAAVATSGPAAPPPSTGTGPPVVTPDAPAPSDPRADAAWAALRGVGGAADAAAALRRFVLDFPRDRRAADAVLVASLLDAAAAAAPTGGDAAGAADALVVDAERLGTAEPATAAALLEAALRLAPGHAGAARARAALQAGAARGVAAAREAALARPDPADGLRDALEAAARWRGLGHDAELLALAERLAGAAADPGPGPDLPDPGPPPTPPPPGPAPRPTVDAPPRPAPPTTSSPAAAPSAAALYAEAVGRFAAEDAAGLAGVRARLEALGADGREARAARGFERFLAGQHAAAAEQLVGALALDDGWVPWVLVRAAFFAGRYDDARRALGRLEPDAQATWRLLLDGPFRAAAPTAAAACEALSPAGRYRVVTDVGLDLSALEERLARAKPEERDELVARARKGHKALAELGDLMDKAARAYDNLLEAPPREQVVPTVYVLSDEARFHAFSGELRSGSTESTLGYYLPGYRVLVFYEREPRRPGGRALSAATQEVLLHETFHQWLRLHVADAPPWFDEGFAEFFAFSEVERDGLRYGLLPQRFPSRLDTLRRALVGRDASPPLPLERLLVTDHEAFMEDPQVFTNYAHGWSVVHFLASSKPGQRVLREYFLALRAGKDAAGARDAAFGKTDLAALDREWRAYVERLR